MLVSMTGFGRGESGNQNFHVVAEVRSVNNRFLDIVTRLPKALNGYEDQVKELVRTRLNRGRVSISVSVQAAEMNEIDIRVDYEVARAYKAMLSQLKDRLHLDGEVQLEHLLKFSEIFTSFEERQEDEELWGHVKEALEHAVTQLSEMKAREGKNLAHDLLERLVVIEKYIREIETISRNHIPAEFESLKKRIQEILQTPEVNTSRLEMEIAILADRLDVTEECVRFQSHVQLFRDLIQNGGFVGRTLNFLTQEMNREANTIGAKASNAEISHRVVFIKEEIERLREQVQNIE